MENASKALLMAGGILIAILIIALLVRTATTVSAFQKARLTEEEQEQIVAFNEQYTKYLNQYVYGTDVLTLINKHDDDGLVKVNGPTAEELEKTNKYKYNNDTRSYSNDTTYYKCTGVTYDSTGRVNSITFQKIETSSEVDT